MMTGCKRAFLSLAPTSHFDVYSLDGDNSTIWLVSHPPLPKPLFRRFRFTGSVFSPVLVAPRNFQEPSRRDTQINIMSHLFDMTPYDLIVCLICL